MTFDTFLLVFCVILTHFCHIFEITGPTLNKSTIINNSFALLMDNSDIDEVEMEPKQAEPELLS